MAETLTHDESRILEKILASDHEAVAALRQQVRHARVKSRNFTGVGFFVHFDVPADIPRLHRNTGFVISDVGGLLSGTDVGFVLFVRDGVVDCLECHTWGDGEVSESARLEDLYYLRHESPASAGMVRCPVRDSSALESALTG